MGRRLNAPHRNENIEPTGIGMKLVGFSGVEGIIQNRMSLRDYLQFSITIGPFRWQIKGFCDKM